MPRGSRSRNGATNPVASAASSSSSSPYPTSSSAPGESVEDNVLAALREIVAVPSSQWHQKWFNIPPAQNGRGLPPPLGNALRNIPYMEDQEKIKEAIALLEPYVAKNLGWLEEPWPERIWNTISRPYLLLDDKLRWAYCQLLRYVVPSRLGEAVEECRRLTYLSISARRYDSWLRGDEPGQPDVLDLEYWYYYGVALAMSGEHDKKARETLEKVLSDKQDGGDRDPIWAKSHLARVLRRTGLDEEAEKAEDEIIKQLEKNPNLFSPAALQHMFLLPGEQTTPLLDKAMAMDLGEGNALDAIDSYSSKGMKSGWNKESKTLTQFANRKEKDVAERSDPSTQKSVGLAGDLQRWGKLITPILTAIAPSALDLFTDFDRVDKFTVVIRAKYYPESEGLEKFSISQSEVVLISSLISRGMVSRSMIDNLGSSSIAKHEQHDELKMHTCLFVLLGGDDSAGTRSTKFEKVLVGVEVNKHTVRKGVYDKNWEKSLKRLKPELRFTF